MKSKVHDLLLLTQIQAFKNPENKELIEISVLALKLFQEVHGIGKAVEVIDNAMRLAVQDNK